MGAHNLTRGTVLADRLEVAETLWARFMGLMGRRSLPAGAGLWLTGTNGIHMFFMRFPIDVVFLGRPGADGHRPVLATRRAVPPWVGLVPLIRGADGCLELPVGTIDDSGTTRGDRVQIS
ncbi:MAG: DUF192 domain-containing protein [Chloroflexota bacterium]